MTDETTLRYTKDHEWMRVDGETITVGITAHAAEQLGDIVYVDLPEVGSVTTAGEVCGEIESTKSVGELFAPVSGTVSAVNDALEDDPAIVNSAPFDAGWLVNITDGSLDDVETLSYAEYTAFLAES